MLQIDSVSFHAQLVDDGRRKQQYLGYTQSGPIDWLSFELVHALLLNNGDDNKQARAAIEVQMSDLSFYIEDACLLCVSIACEEHDILLYINGELQSLNQPLEITKASFVEIKNPRKLNFYVAIKGGFLIKPSVGSVCDVFKEKRGGLHGDGRGLAPGDKLAFATIYNRIENGRVLRRKDLAGCLRLLFNYSDILQSQLPVHFCYQHERFSKAQKSILLGSTFIVGQEFGRQGMRLDGPKLQIDDTSLASEGICNGAIQIAGDGQAMILLCDRQTIGGYPKIGVVGGFGLAKLGQMKAGDPFSFYRSDPQEFRLQRLLSKRFFEKIMAIVE